MGVQVNTPAAVIAAPAGAPESEKVSVSAGTSTSVAVAVNRSSLPSLTVLLPIQARTGASLADVTVIVTVADSEESTPSPAV